MVDFRGGEKVFLMESNVTEIHSRSHLTLPRDRVQEKLRLDDEVYQVMDPLQFVVVQRDSICLLGPGPGRDAAGALPEDGEGSAPSLSVRSTRSECSAQECRGCRMDG